MKIGIDPAKKGSETTVQVLETLGKYYAHVEWCNSCRDWFSIKHKNCPDCTPTADDLRVDWPTEGEFLPSEGGE